MATNPRRESLSLSELLNPTTDPCSAAPPAVAMAFTSAPINDRGASTPMIKVEESRDEELGDEDQELLALAAVEEDDHLGDSADLKAEPAISVETGDAPNLDNDTISAIAAAQNEYGTRERGPKKDQAQEITAGPPSETPKPSASKKRPAPKASSADLKAPTGVRKPPPKKRKVGPGSDRGTPASFRHSPSPSVLSNKPAKPSGNKSKTVNGTHRGSSPVVGSSPGAASENNSEDDGIYCICRKGDNHQWMIACDGGCEDWYHGKCVNVRKEDEGLVDKYICPLCTEKGPNVTTWKPMCRREGCRNPARLRKGAESKYCSDECGVLFMKTQLSRLPGQKQQITPTRGTRGRADTASKRAATTVATAEIDLGPLGGVIRPHELKALALAAPDITTFRRFGSSASLSPTPEQNGVEDRVKTEDKADAITAIDDAAAMRLEAISKRKDALRQRRLLLKDRERFITLAKEQATKLATGMKMKDMCGYDGRLAWDETTFKEWRNSADGVQAFNNSTLDAKSEQTPTANGDDSATAGLKPRPQPMRTMTTETAITNDGDLDLCTKRRCPRHAGWQKLVLHDIRFEETEVGNEMRRIDAEEKGIKENSSSAAKRKNMALSDGDLGSVEAVVQDAMEVDGVENVIADHGARGEDWNAGMASMDMPQAIAASA